MNYLELHNNLINEIPNLKLIDKGFGTGIEVYTERYPKGISLFENLKGEFIIKTQDTIFNYKHDIIKAVKFFTAKAKQDPTK